MTMRVALLLMMMLVAVQPSAAQESAPSSPYAGLEQRAVKALSDEQIEALSSGRGMGLALAAELNGYPGPRHVLDLADQLHLSPDQRARTDDLFARMEAEAIVIGARIIAAETELDALFAARRATPDALAALTARIGAEQGNLRAAHLRAHLEMVRILTAQQVAQYAVLRGYGAQGHTQHGVH